MTLDRSPEFLFKTLNLLYLLKTDLALVNPWWGHFCPNSSIWTNLNIVYPLGDIRDLDLLVSNQEILYVSIYKSM